jgi:hypothetical protein
MSIVSTSNIHHVASIHFARVDHGSFVTHAFTFTTEDGSIVEVSAFAEAALTLTEETRKALGSEVMGQP